VGTPGVDLHPALQPRPFEAVFTKGEYAAAYSGFEGVSDGVPLASWLSERGVDEVDVCGIATDYCVRATALDAAAAGFSTIPIKADGSKAPDVPAWKPFQARRPEEYELRRWYGNGAVPPRGVAVVVPGVGHAHRGADQRELAITDAEVGLEDLSCGGTYDRQARPHPLERHARQQGHVLAPAKLARRLRVRPFPTARPSVERRE